MTEIRRLAEFPDYGVDAEGNVWSFRHPAPRILKGRVGTHEYFRVALCDERGQHDKLVHVLVAAEWLGPKKNGIQVNHKDGDKQNNRLSNLEYVTPSENTKHAFKIGLASHAGEKSTNAILTDAKVIFLRRPEIAHLSNVFLAPLFGVSASSVGRARRGASWSHLK